VRAEALQTREDDKTAAAGETTGDFLTARAANG
jgi:hypothetical protein